MPPQARELATVRNHRELMAVLRARADELQITRDTMEVVGHMQPGYSAKLLGPLPSKGIGPLSLGALLGVLGLKLVVVEDTDALNEVSPKLTKRLRPSRSA